MKERPILFSAPMVRALLAGTKTQTRRVVKLPHNNPLGAWEPQTIGGPNGGRTARGDTIPEQGAIWHTRTGDSIGCPYGQPSDRLWVREAFRFTKPFDKDSPARVAERCLDAGYGKPWAPVHFEADGARVNWLNVGTPTGHAGPEQPGKLRPGIHMPRWASRITLEITGVRVERLQDISEADAVAEGCQAKHTADADHSAREAFQVLWESINGGGSWDANPWVWVVEFRRAVR